MDFARKQLEKYGWTDGKGLGKNENGISEALKPKLKRSVTGIGHDAASDFTEHWWTQLYNKAAGNVEVEEKNGKTKKIKTKDEFEITNSTWKIKKGKKKSEKEEQYADFFVRKAVLTNGGSQMEKTVNESDEDSEGEGSGKKDVFKMTDEELFAACEGRTAHKGARHGLKATGKLARIAQQEQMLLTQSQYEGYSHAKRRKIEEYSVKFNENPDDPISSNKKQKKKKHKNSDDAKSEISLPLDCEKSNLHSVASDSEKDKTSRKSKYVKNVNVEPEETINEENITDTKKKRKKQKLISTDSDLNPNEDTNITSKKVKKKKSKKAEFVND